MRRYGRGTRWRRLCGGDDPDDGGGVGDVGVAAVEGGVTEGEHAAVGGGEPVAVSVGGGGDGDDGLVERQLPSLPWKAASPKVNTPPSAAASQ